MFYVFFNFVLKMNYIGFKLVFNGIYFLVKMFYVFFNFVLKMRYVGLKLVLKMRYVGLKLVFNGTYPFVENIDSTYKLLQVWDYKLLNNLSYCVFSNTFGGNF